MRWEAIAAPPGVMPPSSYDGARAVHSPATIFSRTCPRLASGRLRDVWSADCSS